jgi:riboflavin biosynthesis pyrimidine reductase
MTESLPYLCILISTSIDGRVALGPNRTWWDEGADPRNPPSEENGAVWNEARESIHRALKPNGDMQGSGSFVAEGAALTPLPAFVGDPAPLYADFLPDEVMNRPAPRSWLLVVDGRGRLRTGYKGTEHPGCHMLHLTSRAAPPEYLAYLQRERIPYLVLGDRQVDLPLAMARLKADLGIDCLLSTAGARLNGALLRASLVSEINLILRPVCIGGTATPSLFDGPDLRPDEWPTPLTLVSAYVRPSGYVWLRYTVVKR